MDFLFAALSAPLALVGGAIALAIGLAMLPRVLNALLDVFGYTVVRFAYPTSLDELVSSLGNFFMLSPTVVAVGAVLAYFGRAFYG